MAKKSRENTNKSNPQVNTFAGGLHTDKSYIDQPLGTVSFALNAINETDEGDSDFYSNEKGNIASHSFPGGYSPIGDVYIGNDSTIVFLVSEDGQLSEIGLTKEGRPYETLVRAYLGFTLENQIKASYRLRKGCERTVYFTTPVPMIFNLDKPEDFKTNGQWDANKFKLFKRSNKVPIFESIQILENGALPPGSYSASLQYLDEDLNPTEWITSTEPIRVYNSPTSREFSAIRGSTSNVTTYRDFGITNKSIEFSFANLDTSFAYYRVAIIETNVGSGQVSGVKYSAEIPTSVNVYTYSGNEALTEGTTEDIIAPALVIDQAEYIEQIENRLILSKTKGKQVNFCNLQKYASRITAELALKTVILNSISEANPKTGTVDHDGTGYMPGEIYAFGIVWVFADGTTTPVYHIPGKGADEISQMGSDNVSENTFYSSSSCEDFWGRDNQGNELLNEKVRHHRFPLRSNLNLPLVEEVQNNAPVNANVLKLKVTGEIDPGYEGTSVDYAVEYTVAGNSTIYQSSFTFPLEGDNAGMVDLNFTITSNVNEIVVLNIYENSSVTNNPSPAGLTYVTSIEEVLIENPASLYQTQVMGISFSNIGVPPKSETNGEEIIGYYIVRADRTDDERTILDSAVLAPMLKETNYVAHGHIFPNLSDDEKIKGDVFAMIHPENSFRNKEYKNTTEIIQEGEFSAVGNSVVTSTIIQDVMAGTSYDSEVAKKRESDNDGFSLNMVARDTQVDYVIRPEPFADIDSIEEVFYLDALASKVVEDSNEERVDVFNVSGDNRIGVIQLNTPIVNKNKILGKLPYVILKRDLNDNYRNFRLLPYYKSSQNMIPLITNDDDEVILGDTTTVFNGDSYVTSMRYHSALYYDLRLRKRSTKSGIFNIILGVLITAVGAVTAAFGGGGAALIGWGISQIATGIKKERIGDVYNEAYDAGLRDAINDDDTDAYFGPNPADDTVQWLGDTVTNLWFESNINMGLRNGVTTGITDFMDAPDTLSIVDNSSPTDPATAPNNTTGRYLLEKLTVLDTDNSNGRLYNGFAQAELYELNLDYAKRNTEKIFYSLGLEYDCCTDCLEDFPHRNFYSEQSFQEELSDNYRVFLPNNYRDIEGEKGVITDVFRMNNSLFISTEEALWQLPQNIQERVTGEVVSFIGTGSFFSIPPRKIGDSDKSAYGNSHNWARHKSAVGVFFVSHIDKSVYLFNGQEVKPISSLGNEKLFREKLLLRADKIYEETTGDKFPFANNPSNLFGTGYVSTYDVENKRIIVSKKDLEYVDRINDAEDYRLCSKDGMLTIFDGYEDTIQEYEDNGWTYKGISFCEMLFTKVEYVETTETRTIYETIKTKPDIWLMLDTSNSFSALDRVLLRQVITVWETYYRQLNPDWEGNVYVYENPDGFESEKWIKSLDIILAQPIYQGIDPSTLDIIAIYFGNGHQDYYHNPNTLNPLGPVYAEYSTDFLNFTTAYNSVGRFQGLVYPVVLAGSSSAGGWSKAFFQHILAAEKGISYTLSQVSQIPFNDGYIQSEWDFLLDSLMTSNPYNNGGLEPYNWTSKLSSWSNGGVGGAVTTFEQFAEDIAPLLVDKIEPREVEVSVFKPIVHTELVDGVVVKDPVKNNLSWTMSFSLKKNSWTSFHSYLPQYYIYTPNKFYSWKRTLDNSLWVHNVVGLYQSYYGELFPHIIEYVDNMSAMHTKTWDDVTIISEAKEYMPAFDAEVDKKLITFNKLIAYNSLQCTGELDLAVKDDNSDQSGYLIQQVQNSEGSIIIDRNERDWTLNDLRDYRVNYDEPIFRKDIDSLSTEYFIDKTLNLNSIDHSKHWSELQSLRDKYLVLRLIFDRFDNIKLITNFTKSTEPPSFR